ncbi:kinase-like protein [Aspergillus californicus]
MASSSLSGRAVTSVQPSSENRAGSSEENSSDSKSDGIFVPHVYDFVSIHNPSNFRGPSRVPPLYLEPLAVDQSILVGHGASFMVFKRAIPAEPEVYQTVDMGDWTISIPRSQKTPPKDVVYKVARVAFTDTGTPTPPTRHAMKAALMELYALTHEPLRQHPNIIDVLGLAWGSNYFDSSHRLPVLVMEYADHGSLADLQQKHDLSPSTRRLLALDIGHGLQMLHRCGIIHGDVKSENVLIFSHPEREYIAKLSDFGFSIVGEAADAEAYVGGTRPWKAPEAKSPVPNHLLRATDIYSYGLLLWRLASDGHDPFRFWAPTSTGLQGDHYLQEIEKIKENDGPAKNTALDKWFVRYMSEKTRNQQDEVSVDSLSQSLHDLEAEHPNVAATGWEALMRLLGSFLRLSQDSTILSAPLLSFAGRDVFYGRLPSALDQCLSIDPFKRDLHQAITALRSDDLVEEQTLNTTDILHLSYNHHVLSWEQMRQLEPAVQSFVFTSFYNKVESTISNNQINCPDTFVLASYYINGYGTKIDYEAATRLLNLSSNKAYDHVSSRAYAYRIGKALDPSYVFTQAVYDNLSMMALKGSRSALIDLKDVAPVHYEWTQGILRDVMAGVGASFFHNINLLHGFQHSQWLATFDEPEILVRNLSSLNRISEYKVNKRGDGILHFAACVGKVQAIEALLDAFASLHIDQKNDKGETPLLCATRAGQVGTVLKLIELGADAAVAAENGETCMHWLLSFKDEDILAIGDALMKAGAKLREFTRERVSHSEFQSGIDVDFQLPGSPLTWAIHHDRPCIVQFLLDKIPGGVSEWINQPSDPRASPPPLEYAASYHHVGCLELLLDALDRDEIRYNMAPVLKAATHAADTFSMILRNGDKYEERLHQTLNLCLTKSQKIVFGSVSECHDKVVEYLLSKETSQLVESLGPQPDEGPSRPGAYVPDDINRPAADHRRTPVLEAIRWNRKPIVELLIANGADAKAVAQNPFNPEEMNWTAFHILATAGHNTGHTELVSHLARDAGLPIEGFHSKPNPNVDSTECEGESDSTRTPETPFLVAVQHNAFNLASTFLEFGADPNAVCCHAGLLALENPTTVLGHIIAASAQHSVPRLRYLLSKCSTDGGIGINFIVEENRQLTALHRAAWAHKGVMHRTAGANNAECAFLTRGEYDVVVNQEIMRELLETWGDPQSVNCRCGIHQRTALHLAVEAGNIGGVEMLLAKKADTTLYDGLGLTAVELARDVLGALDEGGKGGEEERDIYTGIINMLLGK